MCIIILRNFLPHRCGQEFLTAFISGGGCCCFEVHLMCGSSVRAVCAVKERRDIVRGQSAPRDMSHGVVIVSRMHARDV